MQCATPKAFNGVIVPCKECVACRVNKRYGLIGRQIIENNASEVSYFLTLTYADDQIPVTKNYVPTLRKADYQSFIRECRRLPGCARYLVCGEYGKTTDRPHYHVCLFGSMGFRITEEQTAKAWGRGFIQYTHLTEGRMQYAAKYALKKVWNKEYNEGEPEPEFAMWSRFRPLGYQIIKPMEEYYSSKAGAHELTLYGDVRQTFRHQNRHYFIGEYNLRKLRFAVGVPTTRRDRELFRPDLKELRLDREAVQDPVEIKLRRIDHYNATEKAKAAFRTQTVYL